MRLETCCVPVPSFLTYSLLGTGKRPVPAAMVKLRRYITGDGYPTRLIFMMVALLSGPN